ncbi:GDSL-type esterase/lipase family protein [Acidicapsa ligni]|uniref:GDSL-type esterase/lipase family protein n=1 Tax=Acidicapsa ligni TaxID=542300 RepID=UPI0021E074A6|nr:GDSL-type esterase/lipase family protein [Acidicapsa ligni]
MGDSITFRWWLPRTNLGVSGNTTAMMAVRFPEQVLGHDYKALVILGGTNDVLRSTGPIDSEAATAITNIGSMASQAEKQGMDVVLCLIPPIQGMDSEVVVMNQAIANFAKEHQYKLVDYYTPLIGHPDYFVDGVHPTLTGYFVMQAALARAIPVND